MNEYKKCHCGADCDGKWRGDTGDYSEPCWGEVFPTDVPDGDEEWGHYCAGHMPLFWGEPYKPKPESE